MNKVKFLFYALLGYGLSLGPGLAADDVPECGWDPPVIEHSQQSVAVVTEDGQRIMRQYKVQEASCKLLGSDKCGKGKKFAGFSGSFTEDGTVTSAYPECCEKDEIVKFDKDDKNGFWTCRNSIGRLTVTAHSGILCCPQTCPEDDPQKQAEIAGQKSLYATCQSKNEISAKLLKEHGMWPLSQVVYDACGCPETKLLDPCNVYQYVHTDGSITTERCFSDGSCGITCPYSEPCACGETGGCSTSSNTKYTCSGSSVNYSDPPECCDGAYQTCGGGCAIQNLNTFLGSC